METLLTISAIFAYLLPILGAIALIVLIVVLIRIDVLVNKANKYADQLQPVITAASNMAVSIEATRLTISNLIKKSYQKIINAINNIKTFVENIAKQDNKDASVVQKGEKQNG